MQKFENFYHLISVLKYGKKNALTADKLFLLFSDTNISAFKRKLRTCAHEARLNGHWVIGDDSGYYLAVTKEEWQNYRNRRLSAINDELKAIASCDKISFSDLIHNVYAVSPDDKNYNLF